MLLVSTRGQEVLDLEVAALNVGAVVISASSGWTVEGFSAGQHAARPVR
jgi:hypothetical protein